MNLAGCDVVLKISPTPDEKDAREVTITTLTSELLPRYHQWVKDNRCYVAEKTDGKVGYIHLPDMDIAGLIHFHRDFLWQFNKQGMVIDIRQNAGGHVSQIILAKLQRKALGYCKPRRGELEAYPYQALRGPIVALCDENTGSDGDIFCQAFKDLNLGTLIGKRTWGGVIGIQCDKRLVDGGVLTQPEFAFWFKSRGWNIENNGVEPDIEVDNDPNAYLKGKDDQLDKAIEVVLEQLDKYKEETP
jgi:tricorn protease